MAAGKRRAAVNLIDANTLTAEEKDALKKRARETIDKEQKDKTADALYAQYLEEERRGRDPQQEMKYIQLDLAEHSDRITMDGTIFFHGMTYCVPKTVYESLREVVARGWAHSAELVGKQHGALYRRQQNTTLHGATGLVSHTGGR